MKSTLTWEGGLKFTADNNRGHQTIFDATKQEDGTEAGPTPMEHMLQSVAACSAMDVVAIIKKKRKEVSDLKVEINGTKRDEHPRIFVEVNIHYTLTSPDAEEKELARSIELSQEKYCGASAIFQLAGCTPTWTYEIIRTN